MTKLLHVFILLSLFLVPQVAANQNNNEHEASEGNIVSVPAGEVINHDYFVFGKSIEISGTVNGDVYAAGGQVLIDGTINGDLLVAGGKVMISGSVLQDIRGTGGQVTISGRVDRNVTIGGGSIELTPSAVIQGGLVAGGGQVHLAGLVEENAVIGAGNLIISTTINGHLKAAAGGIRLTSKAQVKRDFTYWSHQAASIDTQAKIMGVVTQKPIPSEFLPSSEGMLAGVIGLVLLFKVASFVSTLVLGLFIIRVYPKFYQQGIVHLQQEPLKVAGLGFLILLLTPILICLLGVTVIGLPLAFIILAVFFVYLYLSRIFVIAWAGQRLFAWFNKDQYEKLPFVVALLLYFFLTVFPVVGSVLTLLTIVFGLGTLLLTKKDIDGVLRNQGLV